MQKGGRYVRNQKGFYCQAVSEAVESGRLLDDSFIKDVNVV